MTNRRRYLFSAAVLAACVCIALGVLAMLPPRGVTKANFDRIEHGMMQEEVELIFGLEGEMAGGGGGGREATVRTTDNYDWYHR